MRKQAKLVAVLSAAALLAVGASMTAFAATPHWDMEDGEWVYLDRNGDRVTDVWKKSNGQWYYLDSDGYMAKDTVIEGDNDMYYVGQDGARVANAWVSMDNDDLLDDDEEPESIDTVWMYFDGNGKAVGYGESGEVVKQLNYGEGQRGYFMFNTDGYMLSGWKTRQTSSGEDLYYLGDQNEGWARTSWQQLEVNIDLPAFSGLTDDDDGETEWFYFKPNGKAYTNTTTSYNGKTYVFDQYGRMLDLWAYKEGSEYVNSSASSAASSSDGSGSRAAYYADSEGGRGKDWVYAYPNTDYEEYDDDPYWFYLDSKGRPFLADEDAGAAQRVDDTNKAGSSYSGDANYSGHVEAKVIKNSTYLFNNKGVMLTGLFWLGWEDDETMTAPIKKGSSTMDWGLYYFDKSGYPSSSQGKLVTNKKVTIDVDGEDQTYYFGKNGVAYRGAVVSSLVYGQNGQLVLDYGDGSTYEIVPLRNVGLWDRENEKWVLVDKNNSIVAQGDDDADILINGYGRIKTSGKTKDINGDSVTVTSGVVTAVE